MDEKADLREIINHADLPSVRGIARALLGAFVESEPQKYDEYWTHSERVHQILATLIEDHSDCAGKL